MNRAQSRGLGLNLVLPTGNESDVDMTELFAYAVEQPDTSVVCLFVESIRDGAAFLAVAQRARDRGVHVVAAKVGRSDSGAASVSAHTGALAGSDAAYDAAFRRVGIRRARDYDGLHEAADVLARHGPLTGRRLGVICISGAEAASVADRCADLDLELPEPSAATQRHMTDKLKYGRVQNPLDLTGQLFSGDRDLAVDALSAVSKDPAYDAILVCITTLGPDVADWLGPVFQRAQQVSGKPVLVSWWTAGPRTVEAHARLRALDLTVFETTDRALRTVDVVAPPAVPPAGLNIHSGRSRAAVAVPSSVVHSASAAAGLLQGAVPFVPSLVVASADAVADATARLGPPVAVKLATPGLAHKTEAGGVVLGLATPADAVAAYERLAADGDVAVEVQPMVVGGLEVLLGIRRDDTFGATVTVGLGGVWTELFGDVVTELCPVDRATAAAMLGRLRAWPLFTGYRGGPRYDVDALAATVVALSEWASGRAGLRSAELNPLIVLPAGRGVVAVDALVELDATG
jgi:acyl-CoA synthetase (NDP forming)